MTHRLASLAIVFATCLAVAAHGDPPAAAPGRPLPWVGEAKYTIQTTGKMYAVIEQLRQLTGRKIADPTGQPPRPA